MFNVKSIVIASLSIRTAAALGITDLGGVEKISWEDLTKIATSYGEATGSLSDEDLKEGADLAGLIDRFSMWVSKLNFATILEEVGKIDESDDLLNRILSPLGISKDAVLAISDAFLTYLVSSPDISKSDREAFVTSLINSQLGSPPPEAEMKRLIEIILPPIMLEAGITDGDDPETESKLIKYVSDKFSAWLSTIAEGSEIMTHFESLGVTPSEVSTIFDYLKSHLPFIQAMFNSFSHAVSGELDLQFTVSSASYPVIADFESALKWLKSLEDMSDEEGMNALVTEGKEHFVAVISMVEALLSGDVKMAVTVAVTPVDASSASAYTLGIISVFVTCLTVIA